MTMHHISLPISFAAISLDTIPPDAWIAVLTAVLTLAVSAAHARGRKLPLIEWILDAVLAIKPKLTESPAVNDPAMHELLAELKALRHAREKAGAPQV